MSKALVLLSLGVAVPCAAVGGLYLVNASSIKSDLPDDLTKFKSSNGGSCVQALFAGIDKMEKAGLTDATSESKIESTLLSTESGTPEGCLVINWEKDTFSDGKWKGNFRFLWAMKKGTKGFVTYTKATLPGDDSKKSKWEGIAYTLEQESGKSWEIKKKKSVSSNKEMDESAIKTKFPTKGDSISEPDGSDSFGFMNPSEDTDKICGQSDCSSTPTTKTALKGYWKWTNDSGTSGKTADTWSKNTGEWWNELYSKDSLDMKEMVKNVKGSWTKVLIDSNPTTTQAEAQ